MVGLYYREVNSQKRVISMQLRRADWWTVEPEMNIAKRTGTVPLNITIFVESQNGLNMITSQIKRKILYEKPFGFGPSILNILG